jgi:hypothetical protein
MIASDLQSFQMTLETMYYGQFKVLTSQSEKTQRLDKSKNKQQRMEVPHKTPRQL